jgi:hypothetical protein
VIAALRRPELLTLLLLVLILGGAAYEAAIAFEWIPIGDVPGQGATGEGEVLAVSLLAVLAGIAVSMFASRGNRLVAGLAPTAALLMAARFYSFDSYYASTLRRASEGGIVAAGWVYALVALALLAAALALLRPRLAFLGAPVMLLCLLTTLFADAGH